MIFKHAINPRRLNRSHQTKNSEQIQDTEGIQHMVFPLYRRTSLFQTHPYLKFIITIPSELKFSQSLQI